MQLWQLGVLLLWPSGLSYGVYWNLSSLVEHVDDLTPAKQVVCKDLPA